MDNYLKIGNRKIGENYKPLIIAEIGINHEGNFNKAIQMVNDAYNVGCECVKFQSHIIESEMIPNEIIPGNTEESIWEIMNRCQLSEEEEVKIKKYVESKNMMFLSTPFSKAAAMRLEKMDVLAFKIGSGECNNYPLIEHIAKYGKPVILSTGMNNIESISIAVDIIRDYEIPYALLQCTSIYPTPYEKIRLGSINDLKENFPDAIVGLSDHSIGNYTCFGAIPLGARILEKHFTSDKNWPGPDIPISIDTKGLKDLIVGSEAIFKALGGKKEILKEEQPTINFAYACIVTTKDIQPDEVLTRNNIWVKRPGTGEIKASYFNEILGKKTKKFLKKNSQIKWEEIK